MTLPRRIPALTGTAPPLAAMVRAKAATRRQVATKSEMAAKRDPKTQGPVLFTGPSFVRLARPRCWWRFRQLPDDRSEAFFGVVAAEFTGGLLKAMTLLLVSLFAF